MNVIVGVNNEEHKKRAQKDKFPIHEISEAVNKAQFVFLLISDEIIKDVFEKKISSNLKKNDTIVFASGYSLAFNSLIPPSNVDILLISPRVPGIGVREGYLSKKGFFSFVCVHQDVSGNAKQNLLALTKAIGGLRRAAIEVSFKQQAVLSLFTDQTFTYGFIQIMMRSILNLIEAGYPPEAIFVELFLSGEGSFTIDKIIDVGMIKQMNFHSQTSQYGQMSRGIKFRKVANEIGAIQERIFREIENGEFSQEWEKETSKIKLEIMRYFASKVNFAKIEESVRKNLGFMKKDMLKEPAYSAEEKVKAHPEIKEDLDKIKAFYSEL